MQLFGAMIGASVPAEQHGRARSAASRARSASADWSMAEFLFLAITGRRPRARAVPLQMLVGLLISNGPGAITAQGAKGAVAADGPQTPERVQINKAMIGFLTHSGFSHGGNGYEGIAFLLEQFKTRGRRSRRPGHGLDLQAMATAFAARYASERRDAQGRRRAAEPRALPGRQPSGVQGQAGQCRPARALHRRADGRARRIQRLPRVLPRARAAPVRRRRLAQCLLRQHRRRHRRAAAEDAVAALSATARSSSAALETAAFNVFLYGRMIGAAAEIDDHLNRGRNMDTRTPQEHCRFVV